MNTTSTPKIKDVAIAAGVSTATVSRALSKPETVAEETRNAVLDAARATGYRINHAARNLRRQKTGAIVVLVPNLGNPFFSEILAGIESTLANSGMGVLMVDTQQSQGNKHLFTDYLHHSRADGIISLDGSLSNDLIDELQSGAESQPIVFACEWHHSDIFPSARVNNRRGAALAIDHLYQLGHRDIGYVGGPPGNVLTQVRAEGAMNALTELGCKTYENWSFQGDFSLQSGAKVAQEWLSMKTRPTALFCANDEMALGVISELHANGLEVPKHLSVIGFDDIDVAQYFLPPLTTISQPRLELGITAVNLLLERLQNSANADPHEHTVLPVKLINRKSTAALC